MRGDAGRDAGGRSWRMSFGRCRPAGLVSPGILRVTLQGANWLILWALRGDLLLLLLTGPRLFPHPCLAIIPAPPAPLGQEEPQALHSCQLREQEEERRLGDGPALPQPPSCCRGEQWQRQIPPSALPPSPFPLEVIALVLNSHWDQTTLRSKDLCVSHAIVHKVAVKNLSNSRNTKLSQCSTVFFPSPQEASHALPHLL